MVIHPERVIHYQGTLEELAGDVSRLSCKREFIGLFAQDIERQADADMGRERYQLASALYSCAHQLYLAEERLELADGALSVPDGYSGTLPELASEVGFLTYNRVAEFIESLNGFFALDELDYAQNEMNRAWRICLPYMDPNIQQHSQGR